MARYRKVEDSESAEGEIRSDLSGFYRLSMVQRRRRLAAIAGLTETDIRVMAGDEGLCAEQADHMVENALGVVGVPLALCVNLHIDHHDWLVPMAIEEPSVVAAASHAAKLLRAGGGIVTEVSAPCMIGQVQLLDVPDPEAAERAIRGARAELLEMADTCDPCLISVGGGARDIEVRHLPPSPEDDPLGPMIAVHLVVDVQEAMGANTVNSMCELLAPRLEELTGGRARLRIVSNLADRRTVVAQGEVPLTALEGKSTRGAEDLARGIMEASVFAERDPYRAATHNKGIMNGVDAVLVAFGQDWRAVEAGAHAYAARDGRYTALARWRLEDGVLRGRMKLPMPVGVIGGVTRVHPTMAVVRRVAGVATASELARVTAAVGLAQNLGALRALAAEGIQRGHMRVHARNVAVAAGATGAEVDRVARTISKRGEVRVDAAQEALHEVRQEAPVSQTPEQIRARFQDLRQTHLGEIMGLMDEVIRTSSEGSSLVEMCRYHLGTGGKRLRALLPLIVGETLGCEPDHLVPFGAACEMLHNATLVHDDLQDGDELRRGRETVWHRFGKPQAINLGDAMFYYTVTLVHRLEFAMSRREATVDRVLQETLRVIDGQEREFQLKQQSRPSLREYFAMVEGKTSGLFALPMAGAAALCSRPPRVVDGLQEAARHMGVLFQIQDDLLDLYGDKGRDMRGSDIREGKRSVLAVHGLNEAEGGDRERLLEILDKDRQATTAEEVAEAAGILERSGSVHFALEELRRRRERAVNVAGLEDHRQLQTLIAAMCDLFSEPIRGVMSQFGVTPLVRLHG